MQTINITVLDAMTLIPLWDDTEDIDDTIDPETWINQVNKKLERVHSIYALKLS